MDTISGIWGSLTLRDVHQPSGWKANPSPSSQNVNTPKTTARCLQKAPVVLKPIGFGEILGVFQIGGRFLFQELLGNHQCQWRKIRCALSQLFPSVSKPPTLEISPPFGLVLLNWRWKILWHTPPASKKNKMSLFRNAARNYTWNIEKSIWSFIDIFKVLFIKTEGIGVLHLNFSLSPWKPPQVHLCLQPEFLGKTYGANPSNSTVALFQMQNEEQQMRVPWC